MYMKIEIMEKILTSTVSMGVITKFDNLNKSICCEEFVSSVVMLS